MATLVERIAKVATALENCRKSGNKEWEERWGDTLKELVSHLPRGSGFDDYPVLIETGGDYDHGMGFRGSYHPMDEHGSYTHWVDYTVHVRPTFTGIDVDTTIFEEDTEELSEYISDTFYNSLTRKVSAS